MKRIHLALQIAVCAALLLLASLSPSSAEDPLGDYIVLSWNDLGMHCMNKDHDQLSILPPCNNLLAQVIERGDAGSFPRVVTEGFSLEDSIPGNSHSAGWTNFWDYVEILFGVDLLPDIGLTGLGLEGEFTAHGDHFAAEGIPVTLFTDAEPTVEDPCSAGAAGVYFLRWRYGERAATGKLILHD